MPPIVWTFFIIVIAQSIALAEQSTWIDSATVQYSRASKSYDSTALKKTAEFLKSKSTTEELTPGTMLLLGLVYWRLELIGFCLNRPADINTYGKQAILQLNAAEKSGADRYLTASHKALASQLLATLGISGGTTYGPKAAAELKNAQSANQQGYFTLLVEAINANQAPSFAGGNPKKAVLLFEKMSTMFPDSDDVKIHLASAYQKTGKTADARKLIGPILAKNHLNLLAKKIAKNIPEQ